MKRPEIPATADIHRSKDGQFYCVVRAVGNHAVLFRTETMKKKYAVKKSLRAIARAFGGEIPEIRDLSGTRPYHIEKHGTG